MSQTTVKSVKQAENEVLAKAKHKAASPWVLWLERFGFVIRGLIYVVIGILALELAIGAGGAATNPTSAIALIGRQPFGKVLLALIAVGLTGYALWGFVRAILDPLGRGTDTKGLVDRAGFFFSGISYTGLLIATVLALLNKPGGPAQGSATGVPAALMTGPLGKWLTIAFGLIWVAVGIAQLVVAFKASFMRDLNTGAMNALELRMVTWLGKIGVAARGLVVVLIGLLILQPIFAVGAKQAQGFDGALAALAHAPYGGILLGIVAIGLVLFGAYSAMCAKWYKVASRPRS